MATHQVRAGDTLTRIASKYSIEVNDLLAANPRLKANPNLIRLGDSLKLPGPPGPPAAADSTVEPAQEAAPGHDWFTVPRGQLTFDTEGLEKPGSKFHSRVPHVPGRNSGITIGRGYDMKHRSPEGIFSDLTAAGMKPALARKFGRCAGYTGSNGKRFLEDRGYDSLEISPEVQYHLFLAIYEELAGDVIRICDKADVIEKYGETDWDGLDPLIRDITVDLRYRGDYTPATRNRVQPTLVANNLPRLRRLMADEGYWRERFKVPKNRFERRRDYLGSRSR